MLKIENEIIDFIGVEGSGKTSMARRLANITGLPHVTMGDVLRQIRDDRNSPYSSEVREMFEKHTYLDPNTLLLIQAEFFNNERFQNGFILDGGLRTVTETQGFPGMLKKAGIERDITVVHLRVPGWMAMERLLKRGRDDDTIEGSMNRLANFYDDLAKRVAAIEENYKIIHIDAIQSADDTFNELCIALGNRNN